MHFPVLLDSVLDFVPPMHLALDLVVAADQVALSVLPKGFDHRDGELENPMVKNSLILVASLQMDCEVRWDLVDAAAVEECSCVLSF
jgi:hypothetical protein